jgi:APA family basic amino acid/polyamine antiporter
VILAVLLLYRTSTTWPGLLIVLTGIPVYFLWRRVGVPLAETPEEGAAADGV